MWDWMDQESQKPASDTANIYYDKRYDWQTAAFRGLVEAKAHLATDHSLDAALETLFRGTKVPYYLSIQAAANFCRSKLALSRVDVGPGRSYEDMRLGLQYTNTSPRLWDALYEEMGKRPKRFAEQLQAELKLYHPQHPDPWPLLKWWRKAEHYQDHPLRRIESRSSMISTVEICRDLRLVLKHQGHHKDAQWPKNFVLEVFPFDKEFRGRSRRERLTVDGKPLPSLQSFRDT
jgi:hypothetical protein